LPYLLPLVGALLVSLLPRRVSREGAFVVTAINFVLSLHLVAHWNEALNTTTRFRFVEQTPWLPQFGISYHLGVDGISVLLVLLTTFLTPLVILASWGVAQRTKEYVVCLLLLEAAVVGVFCSLDLILFYVFFEAVLIPTLLLIGIWGGMRRSYAAVKFFVYTLSGSILMWVAMLYIYFKQDASTRSFDYEAFGNAARALEANNPAAVWLFGAFALAFAIKTPLFPFHTWLPDAYSEAPAGGTVMMASLLSKMGIYGFLRFAIPFFPETARTFAPLFIVLSIIGIIYGAFVAICQTDIKRIVAYSSVSHLGLIVLGVFAALGAQKYSEVAVTGATLQMVNHGLSTGALFLLLGILMERVPDREMNAFGGMAAVMPRFTVLFWVALFASIGLPGLNGFVGEYLILQGVMAVNFWYAFLAATAVITGAIYMLRLFRNTMYGELAHPENAGVPDIRAVEYVAVAAVLAVVVWIGVRPQPFLNFIQPDSNKITTVVQNDNQMQVAQTSMR
jgi:NADH-quinone oxidoreductase subunit M